MTLFMKNQIKKLRSNLEFFINGVNQRPLVHFKRRHNLRLPIFCLSLRTRYHTVG